MTSKILDRIIEHSEFKTLVEEIDCQIANAGFAPKTHYVDIFHYQAKHANDRRGYSTLGYWHTNVPITDPDDMYSNYYMNSKRQTIHLSVKIAGDLTERNEVHYGGNSPKATEHLKSFVAKLRRYAKKANQAIEEEADKYYKTSHGISELMDAAFYEFKSAAKEYLWRDYDSIVETCGGGWRQILENKRTDEIGKLSWENKSFGYKSEYPQRPTFVIFFENQEVQKHLEELAKPLYDAINLHEEQVILYEQELVVRKLKGIDDSKNDSPF